MTNIINTTDIQSVPDLPLHLYLRHLRLKENISFQVLADWLTAESFRNQLNNEEAAIKIARYNIYAWEVHKCDPPDEVLGLYSAALGIPMEEFEKRDTRFPKEKVKALFDIDPCWMHVITALLDLAKNGNTPIDIMQRLFPETEFAKESDLKQAKREEDQRDRLDPRDQIIVLKDIASYELEEFSDRYMVEFAVSVDQTHWYCVTYFEEDYPGDWVMDSDTRLPRFPFMADEVYHKNLDQILQRIKDTPNLNKIIINGTGDIDYQVS